MTTKDNIVSKVRRMDYPIDNKLIQALKAEYRNEAKEKGNSWRSEQWIEFLLDKVTEEYDEVKELFEHNTGGYGNYKWIAPEVREELLDLILVAAMLYHNLDFKHSKEKDA